MKTSSFIACSLLLSTIGSCQNPCNGTPGANAMLPAPLFTICAGTSASLSLANTYSQSGISYQWQSSSTSTAGPWTNINGAKGPSYTTPVLSGTSFFNVVITCTNTGQLITVPVTVSVVPCFSPCIGASNSVAPSSQTICAGTSATLNLVNPTTYYTGLSFQWSSSASASGPFSAVSGATLSSLVTPALGSTGYYQAVITCSNSGQSFTTTPVAVVVTSCQACSGAPGTNSIVGPSTVCAGSTVTLSLASTYSNTGLTYQWQTSATSIVGPFSPQPGATLSSYTTQPLLATTYFNAVVTCTNSNQSYSMTFPVTVISCATPCSGPPPAASITPASQTVCAGANASLSLSGSYTGSTGYSFQWAASPSPSGIFTLVPSATSQSLVVSGIVNTSYYMAVITCSNGNVSYTTPAVPVVVATCTACAGAPSANTIVPASPTLCAGSIVTLSLATSYTASGITYQWQSSASSPVGPFSSIPGATTAAYTTPTLSANMYYAVVVTCTNGGASSIFTGGVYVVPCATVCSGPPGSNSVLPVSQTVCAGQPASMSLANNYSVAGMAFQWFSAVGAAPFSAVPGATMSALTSAPLNANTVFKVNITCTVSGESIDILHTVSVTACTGGTLSVADHTDDNIALFPIPAELYVTLSYKGLAGSHWILTDLLGRELITGFASADVVLIDLHPLPGGIYFIRFTNASQRVRLVKQGE